MAVVRWCDRIASFGVMVAVATTVFAVAIMAWEMVSRYIFASPTTWSLEMTGYLFCLSIFSALPAVVWRGDSISVTIMLEWLGERQKERAQRWVDLFAGLICLAVFVLLARVTFSQYNTGLSTTGIFTIKKYLLTLCVAGGFFLATAFHLVRFRHQQRNMPHQGGAL